MSLTSKLAALLSMAPLTAAASLSTPPPAGFSGFTLPDLKTLQLQHQAVGQLMNQLQREGREARIAQASRSHGVESHRFQIFQDGIEVIGGNAFTHRALVDATADSIEHSASLPRFEIATRASISSLTAAQLVQSHLGLQADRTLELAPQLKILPDADEQGARLVYWVSVSPQDQEAGRDLVLDAHNGRLIGDISRHIEIEPVMTPPAEQPNVVRKATSACQMLNEDTGSPTDLQIENCPIAIRSGKSQPGADRSSYRAYLNANDVLRYYEGTHGRRSYDGKGTELVSLVHVGKNFANAFWSSDGGFMAYGDGDGVVMTDLTRSLDVAGHEMTHGVTSQTARLIYMDESGALNEAFSDFFGVVIAARARKKEPDWAIGKTIFKNERRLVGLRNLKDPGSLQARFLTADGAFEMRPYPSKVSQKFQSFDACSQRNDRCYVHINSMIPGHAMQQMTERLGLEKTEKLLYLTLTQYLTAASGFKAFKRETMRACAQTLSKADCAEVVIAMRSAEL